LDHIVGWILLTEYIQIDLRTFWGKPINSLLEMALIPMMASLRGACPKANDHPGWTSDQHLINYLAKL